MDDNNNSCNTVFPRDIVCLRNMSINTLHKGDDDDNNNNNNNNNNVIIIIIINTETNDISTMNSNTRIAATPYSLGTEFFSGI